MTDSKLKSDYYYVDDDDDSDYDLIMIMKTIQVMETHSWNQEKWSPLMTVQNHTENKNILCSMINC